MCVIVVYGSCLDPVANHAQAPTSLQERLVLLWGQTILLGYVGQPTSLLGVTATLPSACGAAWPRFM